MRNGLALEESLIGHLSIARMSDTEVVWSIAQVAGFSVDQLHVAGLKPIPDVIVTAMRVERLELVDDIELSGVRLTADRRSIEAMARSLPESEAKAAFLAVGVWAVVRESGTLLLPAERDAVPVIEAAIDRIALEAQYSLATGPDGRALPFTRAALLTDPTAVRITLVHGERTERTWLRSLDNAPIRLAAAERRLVLPPADDDRAFGEAVRAWRRAVRATEPIPAVAALFEAIEFYAARARAPRTIPPVRMKQIRTATDTIDLTDRQRKRLNEVLSAINEMSLRDKFVASLEADGVPYSAGEIDAFWRLRRVRNTAAHGGALLAPTEDDLDLAKGLVNRALAFRAWAAGGR
ncbi:MAG: hypothetical protein ACRDMH_17095 [Solirubrobacterales bacterium]